MISCRFGVKFWITTVMKSTPRRCTARANTEPIVSSRIIKYSPKSSSVPSEAPWIQSTNANCGANHKWRPTLSELIIIVSIIVGFSSTNLFFFVVVIFFCQNKLHLSTHKLYFDVLTYNKFDRCTIIQYKKRKKKQTKSKKTKVPYYQILDIWEYLSHIIMGIR